MRKVAALTIALIAMKLTGLITWDWLWVLSPVLVTTLWVVIVLLVFERLATKS